MNKIVKKLLLLCSLLVLFTACSNTIADSNKQSASQKKTITVTGELATPVARTAYVSFKNITWNVQAYNDKTSKNASVEGLSFSVVLTEGEWTLTAIGTDSSGVAVAAGSVQVEISENQETESVIIPIKAVLGLGNISLKVQDETGKAAKLVCKYKYLKDGNEVTAPDFEENFVDGNLTIRYENVCSGEAVISIYDNDDTVIFDCIEKINVLYDMTTDVWEDCEYVSDGVFTITNENLETYSAAKWYYPVVLWNRSTSDYEKIYREGVQVFGGVDSSSVVTDALFSGPSTSWCFGENGSLYFATKKSDESGLTIEKCVPKKNGYTTKYEKLSQAVVDYTKDPNVSSQSYVYKIISLAWSSIGEKSYLYVLYGINYYSGSSTPVKLSIYDITDWDEEDSTSIVQTSIVDRTFSTSAEETPKVLINDDIEKTFITASGNDIYIVRRNDTTNSEALEILAFKLSDENQLEYQNNDINVYHALTEKGYSDYSVKALSITDMKLIDGYLYILLCSSANYNVPTSTRKITSGTYAGKYCIDNTKISGSAGGILKYNLADREFEEWENGSVLLGAYTTEMTLYQKPSTQYFEEEETPSTYAAVVITQPPVNLERQCFYGPRKIIAKKPDELVIADDGYEYEKSDEKNRIVKVSLKNWAITSVEDAGVMFDGYVSQTLPDGCSGFHFYIQ